MNAFEKFQRLLITFLIAVTFFYGGYYYGKKGYLFEIRKNPPKIEITNRAPQNQNVDFALFWEVWDKVSAQYLERPVDAEKMMYGAISGMVDALGDPYTSYAPPALNKTINEAINGTYSGIGAELDIKDQQLMVVAPLDGSPAKAVGLKTGDKILQIEGESTIGLTLTEAVSKIRGQEGTVSTLLIQRGTDKPFEQKITRGKISIASVKWEDKGDGTAYIRISQFGEETNQEWSKVASEVNIKMKELDAIVLDLRGNPGGYMQSAIYIAGEFYTNKPVVYQENATGEQVEYKSDRLGTFDKVPKLVVLIDGGSASASEILAAALKENFNATLVGEKSFGKGTIQTVEDFSDGSGVHITIAKWLTSKKEWVHKVGIEPDVKVEFTEDDIKNGKDVQLEKALELAKEI